MPANDNNTNTSIALTADIVAAYVTENPMRPEHLPDLIRSVHAALMNGEAQPAAAQKPAVPTKRSVFPDYIICLEDGKKLKLLKRHLRTRYNLTPQQYREKWSLPGDYPMVAPNYAEHRSDLAKSFGLGKGGARG